tara:strand:+ start:20529 stop:20978 length:450 start_codon:yes stop_codon:yes gene_type:complete
MSRGVNKVILIGNLGQKPEIRYTESKIPVANLSIATSESWKDKDTGENREKTEWHRVIFFNKLAEIAEQYLDKGSKVYVEGRIQTRKWQDKETGADRYTTEILGNTLTMLGSDKGRSGDSQDASDNKEEKFPSEEQSQDNSFSEDDIPF